MLLLSMLTAVDVSLRAFTDYSVVGFNEFMELMLAVAIVACFPASIMQRSHLTVDLAGQLLSPAVRQGLAVLGRLLLLLVLAVLSWRFAAYAAGQHAIGQITTILGLPTAPFYWAAAALMTLTVPLQAIVLISEWRRSLGRDAEDAAHVGAGRFAAVVFGVIALAVALSFGHGAILKHITALFGGNQALIGGAFFIAMWVMIFLLVPVGVAMALAGLGGSLVVLGPGPAFNGFGYESLSYIANSNLAVIPLFLMMGNFAAVSGLSRDIYRVAFALLGGRRGGLAMATIGGCAGFGAVTGSSVATAATMGAVTLPEMRRHGYSPALSTGCVAAGGTLGQLVPPSTIIVIYCILVEVSIGQTFIAALIPAAITAVFYIIAIGAYVRLVPGAAPEPQSSDIREIFGAMRDSWGVVFLFALVIGGLYGGIFNATEAAAVGAGTAFLFALGRGSLKGGAFWRVMGDTAATTAMVYLLIIGAITFSFLMGITKLADDVTTWILAQHMAPMTVIFAILGVYLLLGAVMESHAILVITAPIVAPLIQELGYDLVWWGIIMVIVVETGLITPPFGINVFIIKSMAPDVPLTTTFKGVLPFIGVDLIKLVILVLFPALTLWLPRTMYN